MPAELGSNTTTNEDNEFDAAVPRERQTSRRIHPQGQALPSIIVDGTRFYDRDIGETILLPEDIQPCGICLEKIRNKGDNTYRMPSFRSPRQCPSCKKLFHYSCIGKWFAGCQTGEKTCPMCRAEWPISLDLDRLIHDGGERLAEERRRTRIMIEMQPVAPIDNQPNRRRQTLGQATLGRARNLVNSFCRMTRRRRGRVAPQDGGGKRRRKKTRKKRGKGGIQSKKNYKKLKEDEEAKLIEDIAERVKKMKVDEQKLKEIIDKSKVNDKLDIKTFRDNLQKEELSQGGGKRRKKTRKKRGGNGKKRKRTGKEEDNNEGTTRYPPRRRVGLPLRQYQPAPVGALGVPDPPDPAEDYADPETYPSHRSC